ncbi:type II secretion system protein [Pelagibacterales bacterium SAG-MED46]|nr:type II secretion system protein [Pelagibacterales bacterium SAG-MED46]
MKKKNQKGFTLIELLVVVAIIGILASVGVVAYNGYTTSAQKSASNSNYEAVAKWVQNELQKCEVGESRAMQVGSGGDMVSLVCSGRDAASIATAARASQRHPLSKMANPYDKTTAAGTQNFAVQEDGTALGACTNDNRGMIVISVDGDDNIDVSTCIAAAEEGPPIVTNAFNQVIALN